MDLFFYPFNDEKEKTLTRISKTPNISERNAHAVGKNKYTYLSYESGMNQRYILTENKGNLNSCLLYTSPSPRDATLSRMPSSA